MHRILSTSLLVGLLATTPTALAARPDGQLVLQLTDAETGSPIAARIELRNARGRSALPRGATIASLGDHGYIDGEATLGLRAGRYTFDLDAGPEWRTARGEFEIVRHADDTKTVALSRAVDLQKEGWFGADVYAAREGSGLEIALCGEGLTYAPLVAFELVGGRWRKIDAPTSVAAPATGPQTAMLTGVAGRVLLVRTDGPLEANDLAGLTLVADSLREAQNKGLRVIADPTSWAFPAWLAAGVVDGLLVMDGSTGKLGPGSRPLDRRMFPGQRGLDRYREECYFTALNAGLRLPPFAGSGSGETRAPLGASRVYAMLPDGWNAVAWWEAALAGQTFITNGPLLRPSAAPSDSPSLPTGASLTTRDPIEYLEVVMNGQTAASVPIRELVENRGRLPDIAASAGGWVVLRAATATGDRYERAMTAPYYLDRRVSRAACQAMLDWLRDARDAGIHLEQGAEDYWRERLAGANAD